MPAARPLLPAGAPAYQLRLCPEGWRLRVFHLPAAGHAWLREVLASPLGAAVEFPRGVTGVRSVAVLCGRDQHTLAWLRTRLVSHGIPLVGAVLA